MAFKERKAIMIQQRYAQCPGFDEDAWIIVDKEQISSSDIRKVSDDLYTLRLAPSYVGMGVTLRRKDIDCYPHFNINDKNKYIFLRLLKKMLSLPMKDLYYYDDANNLHMQQLTRDEVETALLDEPKSIYVQVRPAVVPVRDNQCKPGYMMMVKGTSNYGYLLVSEMLMLYHTIEETNLPMIGRILYLQALGNGFDGIVQEIYQKPREEIPGLGDSINRILDGTGRMEGWKPEDHGSKSDI